MSHSHALVEFGDESLAVVAISKIESVSGTTLQEKEECIVTWKPLGKKASKHPAKIIGIGGNS